MKDVTTGEMVYMLALLAGAITSAFYENPYFLALFSIAWLIKQLGRINKSIRSLR